MLSCKEFFARHSEYVDGLLSATEAEQVRKHLVVCARCGRYDRVVREGAKLITSRPVLRPDPSFLPQLTSRIAAEDHRMTTQPVSTHAAAYVSAAAVLALAAWIPSLVINAQDGKRASNSFYSSAAPDLTSTEIAWHGGEAVYNGIRHMRFAAPDITLRQTDAVVSLIDQRYSPLILDGPTAPPSYIRVSSTAYDAR